MLTLASLKARRTAVQVPFEDEFIEVGYNPHLLTPQFLHTLENSAATVEEAGEADDQVTRQIKMLVRDWTIYADEAAAAAKTPCPVDAATIQQLPLPFLKAIIEAVIAEVNGTDPKASNSAKPSVSGGSARKAGRARR